MSDRMSLADMAVDALSKVAAMDKGVTVDTTERHVVWDLKRQAERVLESAFEQAARLSYISETMRESFAEAVRHD